MDLVGHVFLCVFDDWVFGVCVIGLASLVNVKKCLLISSNYENKRVIKTANKNGSVAQLDRAAPS